MAMNNGAKNKSAKPAAVASNIRLLTADAGSLRAARTERRLR
jgi:hypothetical protein